MHPCLKTARRIMVRLTALAALAVLLPGAAGAGDVAERRIIGFSSDGNYFAFEQYGRQDGSGFPYADIFVIETARDVWTGDSPFRVLIHEGEAGTAAAREEAMSQAEDMLQKHGIGRPGRLLASNPPAELSADPYRVVVNASRIIPQREEPWTFTLSELTVENDRCKAFTDQPSKGFRLEAQPPDGEPVTLHAEESLPKSRGCPLRYALSDVAIHEPEGAPPVFAVLISVYKLGFEGPDRRFIAVTYRSGT